MQQVFDTHRLLYKNAQLRAFKLDNRTEALHWYNVTETNIDGDDIGAIVYTNELGYLCYGEDRQRVTALNLAESAIVQVSFDNGVNWPVEWITKIENGVSADNIGTLYYSDGTIAFDPLSGNSTLKDFVLKSEYSDDYWAEQQIITDGSGPVTPTQWTKVVIFAGVEKGQVVNINSGDGRFGQTMVLYNRSVNPISFKNISNGSGVVSLNKNEGVVVFYFGSTWIYLHRTDDIDSALKTILAECNKVSAEHSNIYVPLTITNDTYVNWSNYYGAHKVTVESTDYTNGVKLIIDELPAGYTHTLWVHVNTQVSTHDVSCYVYYDNKALGTATGTSISQSDLKIRLTPRGNNVEVETINIL